MKTALIAAAALTLGSGVALAQAAPERGAALTKQAMIERATARFDRRDANGDGVVNEADSAARADRTFARLDTDGDGMISRTEWDAMRTQRARPARGAGRPSGQAWRAPHHTSHEPGPARAMAR